MNRTTDQNAAPTQWLTQAEVARRLSCTSRHVRNLIARGDLKASRLGSTRTVRIRESDLDGLLHEIPTTGTDAS